MTEFKSTQDRINKTIDLINSKLTNHKIKIDRQFIHKCIISMQNDKELVIFDVDDKSSDTRLKMLEDLNNNIELFEEKLKIIHELHNANDDFEPANEPTTDKLNITRIKRYSKHPLHPEECDDSWQIPQIARFEIKHKGDNKVDIHAVIKTINNAPKFVKKSKKEINGRTFAVTREIETDSWDLSISNTHEITIKDVKLEDIIATIQELTEITLDDFRMTH